MLILVCGWGGRWFLDFVILGCGRSLYVMGSVGLVLVMNESSIC